MKFDFPYLSGADANLYSPLALAYIGDAVYETYIRAYVMESGNMQVNKLHRASTHYVSAKAQSKIFHTIADALTEDELAVFRRGRNANSYTHPKNMDISDYRHATGLEAVFGYLYLSGQQERITELFELAYPLDTEEN